MEQRDKPAWTPVGLILEYDDFKPGDIGIILNGPVGYGYTLDDIRKFAAAPAMYEALEAIEGDSTDPDAREVALAALRLAREGQ